MKVCLTFFVIMLFAGLARAAAGNEILDATGVKGGLVVHIGCGDGRLTAALRANDSYLVHGLDADLQNVKKARQYIQSLQLYGNVSVDQLRGNKLPYIDNLVNLVVSENLGRVSMEEVMRVLCPNGVAYIKNGEGPQRQGSPTAKNGGWEPQNIAAGNPDTWTKTVKPWPDNIDQWTHYLHDATNNAVANDTVVGPPRHMQWLAEPLWSRHHDKLASISTVVTAHGRIFYIVDEASAANINLPGKWSLVARDAFSGVFLWKRPLSSWTSHQRKFRSGPVQLSRTLVAHRDRVYVTLGLDEPISVLKAQTGEVINVLKETEKTEEFILHNDILIVQIGAQGAEHALIKMGTKGHGFRDSKYIVAIRPDSGRVLWRWPQRGTATIMPLTLAASGNQVYLQDGEHVVSLDLDTGHEIWRAKVHGKSSRKIGWSVDALVVHEDVVLTTGGGVLTALSADKGHLLWTSPIEQIFGKTQVDVLVAAGLVWTSPEFSEGRDLHTGQVVTRNCLHQTLITAGHHHRCYRNKATERYIMVGKRGIDFLDLESDNHSRNNWIRGVCQYGIMPANGLIYAPPHACGCYSEAKLYGFWALAPKRQKTEACPFDKLRAGSERSRRDRRRRTEKERLQRGPAYYETRATSNERRATNDWPLYRHDSLRSGVTAMELPSRLEPLWKTQIPGRLSAPVIAEAIVLVCSIDAHCVYALDARSG
ncbi:MAG: PQQ-binding-like beta-propeller repeat protein, partial [Sedimentisphaerales bacterium]